MGKIYLNEMEFVVCHGALAHEKKIPQKFVVDVKLKTDAVEEAGAVDKLKKTIHYGEVFQVIEAIMQGEAVDLIETLAFRIAEQILADFKKVEEVKVKVRKMNPPIPNFNGSAAVSLKLEREE
jgi:dihydroneopterin aldolase